jgi:hypothetical protein
MRFVKMLGMILLVAAPAMSEKVQPLAISVYVESTPPAMSPEGFVEGSDKVLVDSARDLRKALDGKSFHPKKGYPGSPAVYHVSESTRGADLTLTIAARGQNAESLGQRTTMKIYSGVVVADTVPKVGVTRWVSMIISVGTYKKEVLAWSTNQSAFSMGAWTEDAKYLALSAAAWVMANEPRIMELRKTH